MFAHPDPTGDDPTAMLSSPGRSREPAWSGSCAGGPSGRAPLLLVCAPVRYLDFLCGTLLALHPTRSAKSACLALLATVHISLADLEVQQMDPVAELNVFWFVHFSCPSEGLCFAHFPVGCQFLSLSFACLCRGLLTNGRKSSYSVSLWACLQLFPPDLGHVSDGCTGPTRGIHR